MEELGSDLAWLPQQDSYCVEVGGCGCESWRYEKEKKRKIKSASEKGI